MASQQTLSLLGSGWLGLPLAKQLVKYGYNLNLSTRDLGKFPALKHAGTTPFLVDIEQLTDGIADFMQADSLIINITSKCLADFEQLIETIAHSPIKQVLFISSTSVYQNTNTVITEVQGAELTDHPLYQIEQAFQQCPHFDTTILRLSGLVGYQRHPGYFFANGKVVAQPDTPVNLIHRDDCIGIIVSIIEQAAWGEVFNGCADSHPTKRDFYSHARQLLNQAPPLFAQATQSHYKIVSNAKIKTQLGYSFIYPDLMQIPFKEVG